MLFFGSCGASKGMTRRGVLHARLCVNPQPCSVWIECWKQSWRVTMHQHPLPWQVGRIWACCVQLSSAIRYDWIVMRVVSVGLRRGIFIGNVPAVTRGRLISPDVWRNYNNAKWTAYPRGAVPGAYRGQAPSARHWRYYARPLLVRTGG